MNHSLSYILPVKNAQAGLARRVERLLEVLSELTPDFELLIVDEGSQDETPEISHDLAQFYPQVNLTRATTGQSQSLVETIENLRGDIVFVADRDSQPDAQELRELWDMRHEPQLVMARLPRGPENLSSDLITRLMNWGDALRDAGSQSGTSSVRMMRRSAIMQMSRRREPMQMAY